MLKPTATITGDGPHLFVLDLEDGNCLALGIGEFILQVLVVFQQLADRQGLVC